ncbi:solute carrier family 49 member 4 homolog [Mya arenaria]|uniref:solute carrier family 49 member 4 homolog n=1 Tax=Mya arenaria TaxID=6604 RepID=UPI0022E8A45B|nr:solute carrier family 49 member 4 homolog [Mya arenaria]
MAQKKHSNHVDTATVDVQREEDELRENQPIFGSGATVTRDPSRWWVLFLTSMMGILNNFLWATWGPISQSALLVYGWSEGTLFWVTNVGNIAGLLLAPLGIYLVDIKGIRISLLVGMGAMAIAAGTRVITLDHTIATILIAVGQGFNGFVTAISQCLPPVVSNTWFGVSERTTVTAAGCLSFGLGAGLAFLFGPLTVNMPKMNGTEILVNQTDVNKIESQMKTFNYMTFGFAAFLVVCTIIYSPAKPKFPPSKSANAERLSLKKGALRLMRNPFIWLISGVYSLPMGFYGNWASFLDAILTPFGIKQSEAGWMNFSAMIGGVVVGTIIGRFADLFKRKLKLILIVLNLLIVTNFAWFTCMAVDFVPRSKGLFFVSVVLGGILTSSTGPLFYEISCDTAYPAGEGLIVGFLGIGVNLGASVFLGIDQTFTGDTAWTNWALVGVYLLAVPLLFMFREKYTRLDIDIEVKV